MNKVTTSIIATIACTICFSIPCKGKGISHSLTQHGKLTAGEAIVEASRHSRPGDSFAIIKFFAANSNTRRIGNRALELARSKGIKLYENGVLANVLRRGGFLIAEIGPHTNYVIALHLVSVGSTGVPMDAIFACRAIKLVNAQDLVQNTVEFTDDLYSTPSFKAISLEREFYNGNFPKCGTSEECTLFSIPRALLKLGAEQNEYREVAALYGGFELLGFRYAIFMPTFSANPVLAIQAAKKKMDALVTIFLRKHHIDHRVYFDPVNINNRKQLHERIDLLYKLDKYFEHILKKEANPALFKANASIATIPLGVGQGGPYNQSDKTLYSSGTASMLIIFWKHVTSGSYAVYGVSVAG